MIQAHQPTIFGRALTVGVSSIQDGTMKFGTDADSNVVQNRALFLRSVGMSPADTTLVRLTYDTDDFAKYRVVSHHDKSGGMQTNDSIAYADALVVDQPNHALFLPLADCVGAVLYDPVHHVLMVSHLGRHSIEVYGGKKSVAFLKETYQTNPADMLVWLSPAAGKTHYPLHSFGGKSMYEVISDQLIQSGVREKNIETSTVDTTQNNDYYSHSQYLKDSTLPNGRFAIVVMMTAQGEPAA